MTFTDSPSIVRLMNGLTVDENNIIIYKETELDRPDGRRAAKVAHTPEAYKEHFTAESFEKIIDGTKRYLKKRFNDFENEPLHSLTIIFDFKQWPKSFDGSNEKKWGFDTVRNLAGYFSKYGYISEEETLLAVNHWPIFRKRVLKCRHEIIYDVYTDMMKEADPDVKGMLLLLEIMMTFSASTAACERGFSSMNRQKSKLRTSMKHSTLDNVLRICVDGGILSNFDPQPHFNNWLENCSGKRHTGGHTKTIV